MNLCLFAHRELTHSAESTTPIGLYVDIISRTDEVAGKRFLIPNWSHQEELMKDNEVGVECDLEATLIRAFVLLSSVLKLN